MPPEPSVIILPPSWPITQSFPWMETSHSKAQVQSMSILKTFISIILPGLASPARVRRGWMGSCALFSNLVINPWIFCYCMQWVSVGQESFKAMCLSRPQLPFVSASPVLHVIASLWCFLICIQAYIHICCAFQLLITDTYIQKHRWWEQLPPA